MSPTHPYDMNGVEAIGFTEALSRLQALLGREVRVLVNFHDTFGGCTIEGRLDRVESVPPGHRAVDIVIDGRQGILVDPTDTEVLLVGDPEARNGSLDFNLPSGVVVSLEVV